MDVWRHYREAGHDVDSMIVPGSSNTCPRCGAAMIDLSEDLVYGEMRECVTGRTQVKAPQALQ